jgi:membrane protein implicated in regulation of membrane protease activity
MCHLVLLMPVFAIALFWVLPPQVSLPLYTVIVAISGLFYWAISRSMMRPVVTGAEALIGGRARVLQKTGKRSSRYLVRAGNEIWTANGAEDLRPGDEVMITAMDSIRLVVAPQPVGSSGLESRPRERHCH